MKNVPSPCSDYPINRTVRAEYPPCIWKFIQLTCAVDTHDLCTLSSDLTAPLSGKYQLWSYINAPFVTVFSQHVPFEIE